VTRVLLKGRNMARPKLVVASSSQSVKSRTITFVLKEPLLCGSFFIGVEKNAATARFWQIEVLAIASYVMVFALKRLCERKHFAKNKRRRGYQADWAVPLRRGGV